MNSLRFSRAVLRVRPTAPRVSSLRRGYAEAIPDKIKLSLALPHQVCYDSSDNLQLFGGLRSMGLPGVSGAEFEAGLT
jgi:F-type H+-transporting ATPase subunit delta